MDSVLQKYAARLEGEAGGKGGDAEAIDDLGSFGVLRGVRERSPMLTFIKKGGDCLAVAYAFIDRIEFNPSEGIVVSASGRAITIRGRNLGVEIRPGVRLFDGLARHRVPWIREAGQADLLLTQGEVCFIESIIW